MTKIICASIGCKNCKNNTCQLKKVEMGFVKGIDRDLHFDCLNFEEKETEGFSNCPICQEKYSIDDGHRCWRI